MRVRAPARRRGGPRAACARARAHGRGPCRRVRSPLRRSPARAPLAAAGLRLRRQPSASPRPLAPSACSLALRSLRGARSRAPAFAGAGSAAGAPRVPARRSRRRGASAEPSRRREPARLGGLILRVLGGLGRLGAVGSSGSRSCAASAFAASPSLGCRVRREGSRGLTSCSARVAAEDARGRELSELVADHRLADVDRARACARRGPRSCDPPSRGTPSRRATRCG